MGNTEAGNMNGWNDECVGDEWMMDKWWLDQWMYEFKAIDMEWDILLGIVLPFLFTPIVWNTYLNIYIYTSIKETHEFEQKHAHTPVIHI